jgi:hypothetical protein
MNEFKIIAGGEELDTYESIPVSFNYQIDDILDIEKRNTNFSKTISLPGTSGNNLFFKQIFDVNVDNINFNPNIKIPAQVDIGGNTVLIGNLQLLDIVVNNEEVSYEVAIFGELKNIINEFGDKTLKDLDFSEFDHTRDKQTIQQSWYYEIAVNGNIENLDKEGRGYVYPYIVNGNSSNIYDRAYIYDLYPAFYLKTYIDKMFEDAGFTYTSNFFESPYFKQIILPYIEDKIEFSSEEENRRKAIVGVDGDIVSNEYKQLTPYKRAVINASNTPDGWYINTPNYLLSVLGDGLERESGTVDDGGQELTFTDQYGQWDGNIFTCNKVGRYNIDFDGKLFLGVWSSRTSGNIQYNSGELQYLYRLILERADGTSVILDSSVDPDDPNNPNGYLAIIPSAFSEPVGSYDAVNPYIDIQNPLFLGMSAGDVFLEPGDKIKIFIGFRQMDNVSWAGDDWKTFAALFLKESFDGIFTKFVVEPSTNESLGNEDLSINSLLSNKIKQKDLFNDVIKAFKLVIQDNPNKERDLIIEPSEEFFKSKQKIKDWTQLLDRESDIKITPMSELDAKSYLYTYQKDEDLYNKEYTDETKRVYAEQEVTVINDFSEKVQKTTLQFAPTPVSNFQINDRVAPFFAEQNDEGLKPKKVKPRMLFYTGLKDCADFHLYDNIGDDNPETFTSYPYVGMWDDPYNPTEDLGFGRTQKIYWDATQFPVNNLYERFHRATLNNIVDKNARLLEGKFYLTPTDIADFDFRDIIFLDGSYWRVNKIKDFNPIGSDSLTTVILYKIIDLEIINGYTTDIPTTNKSCPADLVIRQGKDKDYYASESGQEVSEDCCEALNGNWEGGICYLPLQETGDIQVQSPTSQNKPLIYGKDQNSQNANGVKLQGSGNYVAPSAKNGLIIGNNNTIVAGVENFVAIGDGNIVTESNSFYYNGKRVESKGGFLIFDGGEDTAMSILKTNETDVIDGTIDSSRNPGGIRKDRPIIDGTKNTSTEGGLTG